MAVISTAPGKLMLMGEHAVVYGRPCLVTAVDLRYTVQLEATDGTELIIETPALRQHHETRRIPASDVRVYDERETAFVQAALAQVFDAYDTWLPLKITTDGPAQSYGLGSSSAITAAAVVAALHLMGVEADKKEIFDLAYKAILEVQGKGSGADLAAAVYGGTLYYVRGGDELEQLRLPTLPIVIGYSGQKVSTVDYMNHVAAFYARQPAYIDRTFRAMRDLVSEARYLMVAGDWRGFGELATIHQGLLDTLDITTPDLFQLIYAARRAGAYGSKLSGAGGGDCMYAVVSPEARDAVIASLNNHGQFLDLAVSAPGARIEPQP